MGVSTLRHLETFKGDVQVSLAQWPACIMEKDVLWKEHWWGPATASPRRKEQAGRRAGSESNFVLFRVQGKLGTLK